MPVEGRRRDTQPRWKMSGSHLLRSASYESDLYIRAGLLRAQGPNTLAQRRREMVVIHSPHRTLFLSRSPSLLLFFCLFPRSDRGEQTYNPSTNECADPICTDRLLFSLDPQTRYVLWEFSWQSQKEQEERREKFVQSCAGAVFLTCLHAAFSMLSLTFSSTLFPTDSPC